MMTAVYRPPFKDVSILDEGGHQLFAVPLAAAHALADAIHAAADVPAVAAAFTTEEPTA